MKIYRFVYVMNSGHFPSLQLYIISVKLLFFKFHNVNQSIAAFSPLL